MAGLERIFIKMSISVTDDHIKFKCNVVIEKIKYCIKEYEQNILDNHTEKCIQQLTCNKNRVIGIENIVPKTSVKSEVNYSIKNHVQQNQHKKEGMNESIECMTLSNLKQKNSIDLQKHNSQTLVDHHFSKKPKLMSSDVLNRSTTTGILVILHINI